MTAKPHLGTRGMPRAERETEILRAAMIEFAERGFHQVTMASVAARAGVSKPLVHAYFGTKDALYSRCVKDVTAEILDAVTPVVETAPPGPVARAEFDLGFDAINPVRLEAAWIDLIFAAPLEGPLVIEDLVVTRRPRADL